MHATFKTKCTHLHRHHALAQTYKTNRVYHVLPNMFYTKPYGQKKKEAKNEENRQVRMINECYCIVTLWIMNNETLTEKRIKQKWL